MPSKGAPFAKKALTEIKNPPENGRGNSIKEGTNEARAYQREERTVEKENATTRRRQEEI